MKDQMESEERLKNSGLKTTKSRKAILDILIRSDQPMAAEQIFLVLKEEQIATNLSTVYRTLESDVGEGLIKLINPFILEQSGEQQDMEGCLSIPDISGKV